MKSTFFLKPKENTPAKHKLFIEIKNVMSFFTFFCLFSCFSFNVAAETLISSNKNTSIIEFSKENRENSLEFYQGIIVKGNVSDKNGPMPGVNIIVKDTNIGVQTDFDGDYELTVQNKQTTLVFSYLGYKTQEIIVGNNSTINVVLEEDSAELEEVVILGYSSRKKGEVTGSVSTIKSGDIEKSTSKDIAKSLAGRASGLFISDRGGYPGAGNGAGGNTDDDATTILIRGKSTLGNNSPLILIDGIQTASFSQLAPQDIASLTVLKDGAAAIYGSRAANGVILITTKRGKSGKPKINFSSSYNLSSFSSKPTVMSSEQYAIYENEIADRNGLALPFTQEQINNYASGLDPINFPSTNWADLTFANSSPETRNALSISGGSDFVKYFVSADAISQQGIFASGDLKFKQNQVRSNLDIKLNDDLKIGVDLSGRFGVRDEPGVDAASIFKTIYTNLPTEVGIYPNGLPGQGGDEGNPVITSSNASGFVKSNDTDLRGKFSFNLNLKKVAKGLELKGFAGIRKINNDTKSWYTPWRYYTFQEGTNEYIPEIGSNQRGTERILRESFRKYDELLINTTLHYSTLLGENHNITSFAGIERLNSDTRSFWVERTGFPTDSSSEIFAGNVDGQRSFGVSSEGARLDFFGSLSYNFNKKYFIDFTIRHDGSSNFGPGNRYGTFPSVAASWALDKEGFMDSVSWINNLRIRGSWSKLGNDRIPANLWQYVYNFGSNNPNTALANFYTFGTEGTTFNGFTSGVDPNPNVTWETAFMKNIGLSFALFDNKLSGDINYFRQDREDILVTRGASTPIFLGLNLPPENIGRVKNYGIELELAWADKIGNVSYNFGMNFSQAKNEVLFLDEAANVSDALKREGQPLDSYVVYPTGGIFQNQGQVDATAVTLEDTVEGEPIYLDTNNDGKIDAADRIRIGSSNIPEIQYGIYGGLSYKSFDFSFLLQGQAEAEALVFFDQSGGKPTHVFDQRWTPNNRNSRYPRAFAQGDEFSGNQSGNVNNFEGADLWLHDASFLRLKEVEFAYNMQHGIKGLGDIRLFLRGFNLLTMFSDIHDLGLDPEATGYNNFRGTTYSSLKSYSVGINLSF